MSNLPHDNAHTHVSGQSEYVDDRPAMTNEVYVEVVYSPHAYANIKSINLKKALKVYGVKAIYTAKDFPHNKWGTIFKDQPLLAEKTVQFAGEAVVIVAATTRQAAIEAKLLVEVEYQILPAILSIKDAKKNKAWVADERKIERGEVAKNLSASPHTISGEITIRGADHFYLESQVSVVYPKEDGQLEVHTSSQHPTETQHVVAHSLGLKASDVTCIVKRMGGGFGGKESQAAPFAAYAALVAHTLKCPARITLTKDDDMVMTGKRNPFENIYQVGFDNDGKILALDVKLFSDSGAYADLSTSIMERAMLHIDNAYYIPHLRVSGQVCKTNMHPHTAFRGFGGPKGVATIEKIIEQIAHYLKKDSFEIRKLNVYTDKDQRNVTHYGQVVNNNCLPQLFSQIERDANYHERQKEIQAHNQDAIAGKSHILKGLSLSPVKFGISFTTRFLNQANALVIIHRDGTLQVATGATEMGQGVNARIAELVSREFGINRSTVRMMPTSTDKNANTSPTAASSGTDLNGAAALLAVRKLKAKLSDLSLKLLKTPKDKWASLTAGLGTEKEIEVEDIETTNDSNKDVDWKLGIAKYNGIDFVNGYVFHQDNPQNKILFSDVINEAYLNRISLTEYAHYKFPNLSFNKL
ncbi:MAG: molybdopterin-dependent oxidoreductase, partial [Bdellovibrionales bacterium]|nr:molybdopterin-dependent oxidoreductase [Bdellovibrionales bacterium]